MKHILRNEIIKKRDTLSQDERKLKSSRILDQLLLTKEYMMAREIFTFVSFGTEVDTYGLILNALVSGKKVYTPKIIAKGKMEFYEITSFEDLSPSKLGILEPTTNLLGMLKKEDNNQVMIMPGVAFDLEGNRMGYGGGYYDRYLSINSDCQLPRIAICYEIQMVDQVPVEEFDQKVDIIITEKQQIKRM